MYDVLLDRVYKSDFVIDRSKNTRCSSDNGFIKNLKSEYKVIIVNKKYNDTRK